MKIDDGDFIRFLRAAKGHGASDEFLIRLFRQRGWPDERVFGGLAAYYEQETGLAFPVHVRAGGSSKDAFLYVLAFSTLGTWAVALGATVFGLVDKWLPDPMFKDSIPNYQGMAQAIASVIVAFPIYLFVMRALIRNTERHPEKLDSDLHKWLTYFALLITASIQIGDLVAFLTSFLKGELSGRFVAQVATVLCISGAIFRYYLASLRRSDGAGNAIT